MKTEKTKQQLAIEYMIDYLKAVKEEFYSLKILRYDNGTIPCVAVFRRSAPKPYARYRFRSPDEREGWITREKSQEETANRQLQQIIDRNRSEAQKITEGAILYSAWGYEQTNIDYYLVIARKGDFVTLQPISQHRSHNENYDDRGTCTPDPEAKTGDPLRRKISKNGYLKINSFATAYPWDGQPLTWSSYA